MTTAMRTRFPEILSKYEKDLLDDWVQNQLSATTLRSDLMKESEVREQSREFLSALREAVEHGNPTDIQSADWAGMRELLAGISRTRVQQGFTPSETATFVFSFKEPVLTRLRQELAK